MKRITLGELLWSFFIDLHCVMEGHVFRKKGKVYRCRRCRRVRKVL